MSAAEDVDGEPTFAPPGPEFLDWRARVVAGLAAAGLRPRMVVAGLFITAGLLVVVLAFVGRRSSPPVEETLPFVSPATAVETATTSTTADLLIVHVAGSVVEPGIRELAAGARVADAIDAAGGPKPEADLGRINLAAPLADGQQVYVPAVGEEVPPGAAVATPSTPDTAGPIDLNTATEAGLEELPGIGPSLAAAIIAHREAHGPFTSVDGLLEVRGIGEAKLAALRDLVRV